MPQALGLLLRRLAPEPDFPDIIDTALEDRGGLPCALAVALWNAGRHEPAREACSIVGESDTDAALASVVALSAGGYVELTLQRLIALRRAGHSGAAVVDAVRAGLLVAAAEYERHLASGDLMRALAICHLLVELCPLVGLFRQTRDNVAAALAHWEAERVAEPALGYAQVNALAAEAREQSDLESELLHRLAIWRHPSDAAQHSAVRINNLAIAASIALSVDIDSLDGVRLSLAHDLLKAIRSIPATPRREDGGGDSMVWWERAQRELLGTIDLDEIFGARAAPQPPLPAFFRDAAGIAMDPADIAARAQGVQARVVFFTSASPEYLARYARTYIMSVLTACDCGCLVVICISTPREQLPRHIEALRQHSLGHDTSWMNDPRLLFCGDGFDRHRHPVAIYSPTDAEPLSIPGAYYASAALLRADLLLRLLGVPVFVSGIDTVLQRGVLDLLEQYAGCDVVLNKSGPKTLLGSQLINNLVLAYPTPNAFLFVDFLKATLGQHLSRHVQSTFLDQLGLHMAKHHLMACGEAPAIGYFGAWDINNVMFNAGNYRANVDMMRSFRFLNMFVGAFGDEERLTVGHVADEAA